MNIDKQLLKTKLGELWDSDDGLHLSLLLAAMGLALAYAPTFYDLFNGIWATDEYGHGPIVFAISLWLLTKRIEKINEIPSTPHFRWQGWMLVLVSGILFAVGRSQGILLFEVGSLVLSLSGVLLVFLGWRGIVVMAFPLFFMLFMIPLPGALVDMLTQPMKTAVSYVAEIILRGFGYPVSRTGVVLEVGPYQLLVADACAGLHTLFTLEALGLLYLNVVKHSSLMRNICLATLIVPISFTANVIRVLVLTLITYHFGDEAGQGFLHTFAGMVLFLSALGLIIVVDTFLRFGARKISAR
ncbi:exosortase B [Roseateles sp. BYS180W]|uniref:Exosortase B n=1 Tax=Roseateles rivi TaxID=3299028 RepID=A0ABW7FSI7_9BURK